MKNILICLEKMGIGGVETSVIKQALEYKRKKIDCVIASVSVIQVAQYIDKADFVLVAPQLEHEYKRILQYARPLQIPVLLIGRKEYGEMDGKSVLMRVLKKIELNQEDMKMDRVSAIIESKLMPIALKFGSNRTLSIIRNAMCASMALLIKL